MIHYIKYVISVLVVGVILNSCDSSTDSSQLEQIYGRWVWESTGGGWMAYEITPDTVGYNCTYEFIKPNVCNIYKDSIIIKATTFSISQSRDFSPDAYEIDFNLDDNEQLLLIDSIPNVHVPWQVRMKDDKIKTLSDMLDMSSSIFIKQ